MNEIEKFLVERREAAKKMAADSQFVDASRDWLVSSAEHRYSYNFDWLGRPIIQYPQDIVAVQELIWECKPDLIIETGIAHGGSILFSSSMLTLLDVAEAIQSGNPYRPEVSKRKVLGIDIDIRKHNRDEIERHPFSHMIEMIEGSSVDPAVLSRVKEVAKHHTSVMVLLDSNHSHEHVMNELMAYGPLVSKGSYCVVFDTMIDLFSEGSFPNRPWDKGDSPMTAVDEYIEMNKDFEINNSIDEKLQISVSPRGYLKRTQ
jgi:cephalosporin hydroxylase